MNMIRVFIIDDHYMIQEGFIQLFNESEDGVHVVGSAFNIEEAIAKIPKLDVQIIILDLFIKFFDPIVNINCIRNKFPSIPIIILSQETSAEWQIKMFREGAAGYLSKEDKKSSILQTIYMVANGHNIIPTPIAQELKKNGKEPLYSTISQEEREIVGKMITGYTIKEVAATFGKSISAIEKALKKIRQKYNARTNFEMIHHLLKNKIL
jgi:DNA-binding NarL/FixJ family response regulator